MKSSVTFNLKETEKDINKFYSKLEDQLTGIMEKVGEYAKEESIKRCPIDEGNLQHSHELKTDKKGTTITATVYIPSNSPAADYALIMHEDTYELGPISKQKQAATGITVGPKYLERAIAENERRLKEMFNKEIKKAIAKAAKRKS